MNKESIVIIVLVVLLQVVHWGFSHDGFVFNKQAGKVQEEAAVMPVESPVIDTDQVSLDTPVIVEEEVVEEVNPFNHGQVLEGDDYVTSAEAEAQQ